MLNAHTDQNAGEENKIINSPLASIEQPEIVNGKCIGRLISEVVTFRYDKDWVEKINAYIEKTKPVISLSFYWNT